MPINRKQLQTLAREASKAITAQPGIGTTGLRKLISGRHEFIDQALAFLVKDGYVEDRGDVHAHRYHSLRPYEEGA
jgi:hypothetical protein